jgi:hypothetical protein
MKLRFMGLPIRRLPYLFARPYTRVPAADAAHPIADARQADDPCRSTQPAEATAKNSEHLDSAVPTGRLVNDLAADHRHE